MRKKTFTLVEMMVVMAIMIILFAIGTVAFNKAYDAADIKKCKAELAQLKSAIEMYRDRHGSYPVEASDSSFNFAEHLSKVVVGDTRWSGKRPMYIKFTEAGFDIDEDAGENYDDLSPGSFSVYDPWGNDYLYSYDSASDAFVVASSGADGGTLTASWSSGVPTVTATGDVYTSNDK